MSFASHSRLPAPRFTRLGILLASAPSLQKTILNRFFSLTHSLLGGREAQFRLLHPTQKGHLTVSFALDAGVGFEPHDLRVMSPTSYQAALPCDVFLQHRVLYHKNFILSTPFLSFFILFLLNFIILFFSILLYDFWSKLFLLFFVLKFI